jgi:glutathione S-transferase
MLELYHHGSSVCAAKVRIALHEKGLDWEGHYLDILKGDQFDPEYIKLNPKAVVPTLVHDGNVIVESTLICEYLDEVFPAPALKPNDPVDKVKMRLWTKAIDEDVHPACATITFISCHRHIIRKMSAEKVQAFLSATPPMSVAPDWSERKKKFVEQGFYAPGAAQGVRLYDTYLGKMETALQDNEWLAGDNYSLADIGMTPYVNRLDMLSMSELWEKSRPRVADWFERIKARPSFKPALLDMCPEQLTNDLKSYGAESLWDVKRVLAG